MTDLKCEMSKAINGRLVKCQAIATVRVDGHAMCGSCLVSSNAVPTARGRR